ncbi:hypothetical protein KMW28_16210 [Flammeovirga yaeyamensis]|uniref:Transcriptional regulator n=1 Tax=Flammeovirga yaeyamensis TaxID=367791 RepID=A0AAX1N4U5_9BACT|nr:MULTISPECIES: hypothetical protein [Flammeovirga]ANQ47399.2 hypothetical protein MY04_0016 [Flammeovirga sp. MY04]MBB3698445.1 Mn-dependent DtxR family transcriptional regulator [Flammeovirga yaeyamensis]NMF34205.1 hypothetical protein [Flammeovirga yaeyamensis]QWG01190.1 hypothetical protein KMW28_16210 [Flammeovirga yaeyamensis]
MSTEKKISKFLVGLCLNTGGSFQDVAKNLGICATTDEIEALVNRMHHKGLIKDVKSEGYKTKASLTNKGIEQAQSLMEWAV